MMKRYPSEINRAITARLQSAVVGTPDRIVMQRS